MQCPDRYSLCTRICQTRVSNHHVERRVQKTRVMVIGVAEQTLHFPFRALLRLIYHAVRAGIEVEAVAEPLGLDEELGLAVLQRRLDVSRLRNRLIEGVRQPPLDHCYANSLNVGEKAAKHRRARIPEFVRIKRGRLHRGNGGNLVENRSKVGGKVRVNGNLVVELWKSNGLANLFDAKELEGSNRCLAHLEGIGKTSTHGGKHGKVRMGKRKGYLLTLYTVFFLSHSLILKNVFLLRS